MSSIKRWARVYVVAVAVCGTATAVCATAAAISASPAYAGSDSSSTLSQMSALSVVTVPLAVSEGVTTLSVQGVRALGDGLELSVRVAGHASEFLIKVPAALVGGLSVIAGTTIEVSTDAVGHVLRVSGKAIAYVPNELGRSLIHHAPISRNETVPGKSL